MTRGTVAWVIALALAAGASWLQLSRKDGATPATTSIAGTDLGYYLIQARIVGLDSDGRELYTVHADRIEHLPEDGSVTLQHVSVEYASTSATPWLAQADAGRIPASGDVIELAGDVRLARSGADDAGRLTMTTTRLELAVRERIARTAEAVDLEQGGDTLTATGFEVDLANERVRLESRVRARFRGTS